MSKQQQRNTKADSRIKTIGEICTFTNGHGFRPKDWDKEGLPIIRIQNLNGSTKFNYFSGDPDPKWIVETGDLLFAWAGTQGVSFGPTIWEGKKGLLNQHIYRIHPNNGINKEWLYYALSVVTARIEQKAHGFKSTLLHVHKKDITSESIFFHERLEQNYIVEKLSNWKLSINTLENLIHEKTRLYNEFKQQLLFGKLRLSKFRNSAQLRNPHGVRIPSNWAYPVIEDISSEINVKNSNGKSYPVLSCTKHHGLVDSLSYFGKQVFSKDTSTYKVVSRGQFAYATNHIEEGSVGYQDLYDKAVISPMYTVFETNDDVDDRFLFLLLKTERYRRIFESRTSASVNRRGSLRWKEFSKIHIPLPPLKEQEAIVNTLDCFEREIDLLKKKLESLKRQKQGLMQQLLTGKIPVKPKRK